MDGFFCGGVILDATHVATAAHCVFDEGSGQATPPGQLHVLAGTDDLNQPGTDDTGRCRARSIPATTRRPTTTTWA